ncbi:MAG TPA: O-methyltransferase [Candidatus Acidoferrales bacterium]|nr:O-methyltransferase [Candidatus Acidoferrales bacterium]
MNLPKNLRSGFMNEKVEDYLYELLPKRDKVLSDMEEYAAQHKVPIIGPAVARILALLVQISGAKRIFELGSAIGYSTIWLARAAGPQAEITYTDGDPKNAKRAKAYFKRAGVAPQIRVETGDALTLLKKTPGEFDLIFNDINKREYPDAAKQSLPRLRRGGLFITDNTLWSGKAARKAEAGDADTRGVQEFNRMVYESKDLFSVLIPLRDGVTVCRKL